MAKKRKKYNVLKSEKLNDVLIGYKAKVKEFPTGKAKELIYDKLKDALAIATVNHMFHEKHYVFDEFYLNEFEFGDEDWDEFDENLLVIDDGEFNPLEFSTIYDFINSSQDDYDYYENWGNPQYRQISIEPIILEATEAEFNKIKPVLIDELQRLGEQSIADFVTIIKSSNVTYRETRENKLTGQITEETVVKTQSQEVEEYPSYVIKNIDITDIIEESLECVDCDFLCQDYIEDVSDENFKELYLRGCELLGYEDNFYKNISFENREEEAFLYDILKESVDNGVLIDSDGNPAKAKPLKSGYRVNKFIEGFKDGFFIDNQMNSIDEAVEYIRYKVINKQLSEDELNEHLKLLASIYAYQIQNVNIDKLKQVFEYEFLRNALLDTNIEWIIQDLYNRCKTNEAIKNVLPAEPKNYYPLARKVKRHFVLHVGPTNSGKTYESLEKFKQKESGVYLAPLRLLALEVQEKMVSEGLNCSLLTGEEEDIKKDSKHICCTIEKLNFSVRYDIAIIDEAQMLEDAQRGAAWTSAILGVCAKEVHICCASYAQNIITELINYCGDTYEIVNHSRDTELVVSQGRFDFLNDLQKGDAVVAFSKRKVLNLAAKINTKTKLSCSVLFGGLPYRSRKRQFQNFAEGKSDVLITTDAVGMGVNLSIKRIIFMEDSKFDGTTSRYLNTQEILQIAGRAGRKNIYDEGTVILTDKAMRSVYESPIKDITKAYIGLTHHLGDIDGEIRDIIFAWQQLKFNSPFVKADISNQTKILNVIADIDMRKSDRFKAIFLPVNTNSPYEVGLLKKYLKTISQNLNSVDFPHMPSIEYDNKLQQLEEYSKGIDLYYSFCKTYDLNMDVDKVEYERETTCNKINNLLLSDKLEVPKCSQCGKELDWDYNRYRCWKCYSRRSYDYGYRSHDYEYNDWDDEDFDYI